MRPVRLIPLVLSAALGAIAVLGLAAAAGWVGGGERSVVVATVTRQSSPSSAPAADRDVSPRVAEGFDPARIYAERAGGVVTLFAFFDSGSDVQNSPASQGSGFVVSEDGHILTNSHVITTAGEGSDSDVRAATRVYVEFADGDRVVADIVGWDIFDDVGVLKVDPRDHKLTPVPLGDSAAVVVGESVAAIGSPFGNESSLAVGVVSATNRSIESLTSRYDLAGAIQTDAPINKGNSGGPLFDSDGRVIGINAQIRSQSGNGEGVGFAVPINAAKRSLEQLISTGRVRYSYVGIKTEDLTPAIAGRFGDSVERGAVIETVGSDSPAQRAGLRGGTERTFFRGEALSRGGDIVVAINGLAVRNADDLVRIVAEELSPGQTAIFTIVRGKQRLEIPVVLGERPSSPSA